MTPLGVFIPHLSATNTRIKGIIVGQQRFYPANNRQRIRVTLTLQCASYYCRVRPND